MPSRRSRIALVFASIFAVILPGLAATGSAAAPGGRSDEDRMIARLIEDMTLEEKVGQMFYTYGYGQTVDDSDPAMVQANQDTYGVDNLEQLIDRYHLGGVIYFAWSNNVNNPEQVAALSNGVQRVMQEQPAQIPALISTDQEQGVVVRIGEPATQFPGNMALGAARDPRYARRAAVITGEELRAMGVNQNMAPVADVNVNPENPVIGVRSFSSDPDLVEQLTQAQVDGYQPNVGATAKHFPGHGDTNVDSHTGLPVIDHTLEELNTIDLPPFQAAIDARTASIMTAHIVVPALDDSGRPATLSEPILGGLLRGEMGYNGVVVTDALNMEGVREMFGDDRVPIEAIKAGADMLLMPPEFDLAYNAVLDAVEGGEISEARIDESVDRILRMKARLGLFEDPFVDEAEIPEVVGTPRNLRVADRVTDKTVTLVENDAGVLPLEPGSGMNALVTGWGVTTTETLAGYIGERGLTTEVYETGLEPSADQIAQAVARSEDKDIIVVTTNKAWAAIPQQDLVNALIDTGKPVVVLAVRDPYDIAYFTDAETYIATYSYAKVSLAATTRVLFGEVDPSGLLPVDIPVAGDPGTILYPFGHGLSYGN
jgi:beta-N-acetylhexosaminidase